MEEYTWIGLPRCFTTVSFYKDSGKVNNEEGRNKYFVSKIGNYPWYE